MDEEPKEAEEELPNLLKTRFTNSNEKIDRYEIQNANKHKKQVSLWDELSFAIDEMIDDEYYDDIDSDIKQQEEEDEEKEIRALWSVDDYVLIYSRSKNEWTDGQIVKIDGTNKNNEWLHVRYGKSKKSKKKIKKIQRNCKDIKSLPIDHCIFFEKGSLCKIYSFESDLWCDGKIDDIFIDSQGEWLKVKYREDGKCKICDIQRYSEDIKLIVE